MNLKRKSTALAAFGLLLLAFPCWAHLLRLSSSDFVLNGEQATWILQVHATDFDNKFGRATEEEIKSYLPSHLTLARGEGSCQVTAVKLERNLPLERVILGLSYQCPASSGALKIGYSLFYGDPSHRHVMKLTAFGGTLGHSFSPDDPSFTLSAASRWKVFGNFLKLGLEHILAGYDHILFLVTLVFAAHRFKDLFGLITAFTVGHSISLALSVQNIFSLSPSVVEPLIAASIVFVAVHDLLRRPDRTPWVMIALTFVFGLIHGLGFSYALREADLSGGGLTLLLFSFNLGVELGQVLLISAVYPLLSLLRRFTWGAYLVLKRACLAAIALVGLYWIVERVFFTSGG